MNLFKYTLILALVGAFSSSALGMEKKRSGDDLDPAEGWKHQKIEIKQEYKDEPTYCYLEDDEDEESTQAYGYNRPLQAGNQAIIEPEEQETNRIDIAIPDVDTSSNNNALPKTTQNNQASQNPAIISDLALELGNLQEFIEKKFSTTSKILKTIIERINKANNQIDTMASDVAALKAAQLKPQPTPPISTLKPEPKKAADKVQMIMVPGQRPGMTQYVPATAARELQWVDHSPADMSLIPIEAASTYYPGRHLPLPTPEAPAKKPAALAPKPAAPAQPRTIQVIMPAKPVAKPGAPYLPFDKVIPGFQLYDSQKDTQETLIKKIEANKQAIFKWVSDLARKKDLFPVGKIQWDLPLQILEVQTAYNSGNLQEATRLIHSQTKRATMTYAISNGIANLAQAIIASGYDPNLPVNSTNNTPLANAAELEREEIVEILLKAGAQINHQSAATNNIALHYACHSKNDNPAIINKLIQAGATVNAPTKSGLTPLMIAISKGHLSQVKALLAAKARVDMKAIPHNKSEWTALDFAKKYPMPDDIRAEIIKLLKKHGAQE